MSEVDNIYKLKDLLSSRRQLSRQDLMNELEVSRATLTRYVAKLRNQLNVPVQFDRDLGRYVINREAGKQELPGVWFSQEELHALLTIQSMLTQLEPGLLGPKLRPLQSKLNSMIQSRGVEPEVLSQRVRLVHAGKRRLGLQGFETVAKATLERKRLRITHFNRQTGQTLQRTVSPQQLVHYRENWYLDAFCHLRKDVRSFAVDAITDAKELKEDAKDIDTAELRRVMQSAYGIFGGHPKDWAELKFSPLRARWVRQEEWHPDQQGRDEPDGSYVLRVPYSDARELVGDILRFGGDVEVVGPPRLRHAVCQSLIAAVEGYSRSM